MRPVPDDALLISESLASTTAFAGIFDRHAAKLLRYLSRRIGPVDAEDLLGELFRIAFESRARYDLTRSDARPWLYGVAANLVLKHLRSTRRGESAKLRLINGDRLTPLSFDDEIVDGIDDAQRLQQITLLLDFAERPTITDGEITVRLADLTCDSNVGLTQARHDWEHAIVNEWSTQNADQITVLVSQKVKIDQQIDRLATDGQ